MKKLFVLFLCLFVSDSFASGIESNSASAPCTNNTLETYSGNSNLAADWQPNTINLRWYNENEKLTVQQSAQSCVYDGGLAIPSTQPTRTGYTFAGWTIRMPGTYTELEYLEGAGTQYIDTGIKVDQNVNINVKAKVLVSSGHSEEHDFIGNHYATGAPDTFVFGAYGEYIFVFNRDLRDQLGSTSITNAFNTPVYVEATFYPNDGVIQETVGQTTRTFSGSAYTLSNNTNIAIFARGMHRTKPMPFYGRIYYLQLTINNNVVGNFIPARRNSDGVLGMYNTITQTFLTNAGSGAFVAGPVVQ